MHYFSSVKIHKNLWMILNESIDAFYLIFLKKIFTITACILYDAYLFNRYKDINIVSLYTSVVHVTHSYFRRLPARGLKLRFEPFFPLQINPLNLESQIQTKNIPEFPNQN